MTAEKFCLAWNDFQSNISAAFCELRNDKDFFDVTLACDDEQIQAHKVILSACSPFFRSVLRRNPHAHPLLYLKGVSHSDMLALLDFMYQGEVTVSQEELGSFLAVAEDLKVKGLSSDLGRTSVNNKAKTNGQGAGQGFKNFGVSAANSDKPEVSKYRPKYRPKSRSKSVSRETSPMKSIKIEEESYVSMSLNFCVSTLVQEDKAQMQDHLQEQSQMEPEQREHSPTKTLATLDNPLYDDTYPPMSDPGDTSSGETNLPK